MDPVDLVMFAAEPAPDGAVMLAVALLLVGAVIGGLIVGALRGME